MATILKLTIEKYFLPRNLVIIIHFFFSDEKELTLLYHRYLDLNKLLTS